jgi:hypothetical protein
MHLRLENKRGVYEGILSTVFGHGFTLQNSSLFMGRGFVLTLWKIKWRRRDY